MSQFVSEVPQFSNLASQISTCLHKNLKSAQIFLDGHTIDKISSKIQEISNDGNVVEPIEYFLQALISNIKHLKQTSYVNFDKEDYENLQNAVQKAEAEIRKHIRLEQQLKIYMDGLEQKIQQLEKQLLIESHKYMKLYENTKAMDVEKKQLRKKLKSFEMKTQTSQQKDIKTLNLKPSKQLTQPASIYQAPTNPYRMYNEKTRISGGKNPIDRSEDQKALHISQGCEQKKKGLDGEIYVSLGQSRKKSTQKSEIKQMTQTIQLKENAKKQSRKLIKYSTQQRSLLNRKDARSNSVCH